MYSIQNFAFRYRVRFLTIVEARKLGNVKKLIYLFLFNLSQLSRYLNKINNILKNLFQFAPILPLTVVKLRTLNHLMVNPKTMYDKEELFDKNLKDRKYTKKLFSLRFYLCPNDNRNKSLISVSLHKHF